MVDCRALVGNGGNVSIDYPPLLSLGGKVSIDNPVLLGYGTKTSTDNPCFLGYGDTASIEYLAQGKILPALWTGRRERRGSRTVGGFRSGFFRDGDTERENAMEDCVVGGLRRGLEGTLLPLAGLWPWPCSRPLLRSWIK